MIKSFTPNLKVHVICAVIGLNKAIPHAIGFLHFEYTHLSVLIC